MIDVPQAFWLALLQGITEFLPISSSGHLILVPHLLGWPDQGLMFDVAVHLGALVAVVIYLRQDVVIIARGLVRFIRTGHGSEGSRLGILIVLATLPVLIAGLWIDSTIAAMLRQPLVISLTTVVFGVVLLIADRLGSKQRKISEFGWQDALIIGVAQALALIPGTSRAGITMTAALIMGGERSEAARFSFLLSIPVILAAGTQQSFELVRVGAEAEVYWPVFLVGVTVAATSAWLVLKLFMHWIERAGMLPFVLYRLILGVWLFVWFS